MITIRPMRSDEYSAFEESAIEDDNGRSIGHIWCGRDPDKETRIFLFTILVFKEYRDRGIGSRALQLLEQELKVKGYKSIGLHVYTLTSEPCIDTANWDTMRPTS